LTQRAVHVLGNMDQHRLLAGMAGGTEVFWGHSTSLREANGKRAATADAARQRGWTRYDFEVVELVES
jgi:hypothetical protein